jgi:hypothetical protein
VQKGREILSKAASIAIEIAFERDLDACEGYSLVGDKRTIKRVGVSPPELAKDLNHGNRPHGYAMGIGNMTQFLSIRR